LVIRQTIDSLEKIEKQIYEVESSINSNPLVVESPLHQIKDINNIEIAYIMSAIISIQRFPSAGKLVAYAGLDPVVRQSGAWSVSRTRMSKRSDCLLKYALVWTADNVRKHPSKMKDFYEQ
jgi:transposase